ncbi:MAG: hypothetical protein GY775_19655 [Candidatus Scalindua sp.]|nr:hypothetical protein [Candidatus Scalindua sp.]
MAIKFLSGESVDGNITLPDNKKIILGTGDDLTLKHNGSDSFIENQTGHLNIVNYANDKDIIFWSDDGSGGIATYFTLDGSLTQMWADKDLQFSDNIKAKFGGSSDLQIYHNGSNSFISDTGTGLLVISSNHLQVYNAGINEFMITAVENGAVNLYYDGSSKLETTSSGISVAGEITLSGTGRIQGVDTVSASTDAANKAYVDAHTSGIQTLTEGDGIKISGTTAATISVNYDASDADNLIQAATAVTSISGAPSGYAAYVLVAESNPGTTYGAVNKIRVSDIHLEDFGAAEGNINLNSNKITNLSTPTASADAANKSYVDSAVAGSPQGTVTGSGTSTRVAFWSSSSALSSDGDLFWDNSNKYLGVGTSLPSNPLDVLGNFTLQGNQYMADNYQIILGNGSDLKIFHDGTDSRIQDSGNGLLKLQGSAVYLQHTSNGTTFTNMIEAISTYVKLNYSGSTKLQTANNGVNITGLINITGDAYVQGGDIHMKSNINVISNSASDVNLIIGDVANNDTIEQIDFHTFGKSQLTLFDDETTLNSSNVILGSDSKFTTGTNSQIKYNATFSSSFKANGLFMPTGVGTSQTVTQGLLYALTGLGSWIAVQNSSSNSTRLLAIAAGSNVLSGMLLQGVFKSASHGFSIGAPIYINSVSGTLTTTVPTASGAYARVVGHAVDSDFILFNPDNTWVKLA